MKERWRNHSFLLPVHTGKEKRDRLGFCLLGEWKEVLRTMVFCLIPQEAAGAMARSRDPEVSGRMQLRLSIF